MLRCVACRAVQSTNAGPGALLGHEPALDLLALSRDLTEAMAESKGAQTREEKPSGRSLPY